MNFSVQPIAKWVCNPLLNFSVHTKTDQIASVNATTLYIQRFGLGYPGSATEIHVSVQPIGSFVTAILVTKTVY